MLVLFLKPSESVIIGNPDSQDRITLTITGILGTTGAGITLSNAAAQIGDCHYPAGTTMPLRPGDTLRIGPVEVVITRLEKRSAIRLGFRAPQSIKILRAELLTAA